MISLKLNRLFSLGLVAICLIFIVGGNSSRAQESPVFQVDGEWAITISANGSAPLVSDEGLSREAAIQDALIQAVYQAAIQIVGSQNSYLDSPQFNTFIADSYTAFVSDYMIRSGGSLGSEYHVSLDVNVKIGELSLELFRREVPFPKPRVMVIISEKHNLQTTEYANAESTIIRGLVEAGFDVVDQTQSVAIREDELVRQALQGSPEGLLHDQRIIDQRAEILVVGEALSELADTEGGLFACRAAITVRVIQVDSAKVLSAFDSTVSGRDTTELLATKDALSNSGNQALQYLIPDLLMKFNPYAPHAMLINVYGIEYADLVTFEHDMSRNVLGVTAVYRRNYATSNAELEVMCTGSAQNLADNFILNPFTQFTFDIVEFSENRIDLRITGIDPEFVPPSPGRIEDLPFVGQSGNNGFPAGIGEQPVETSSDPRIRLTIVPFDDPAHIGLGTIAANTLRDKLNKLRWFNFIAAEEIDDLNQILRDRANWYNMDISSFGTNIGQADFDWMIVGSINSVVYTVEEEQVDFDNILDILSLLARSQSEETTPSWVKKGTMEISIKMVDLRTFEVMFEDSLVSWDSQSSQAEMAIGKDEHMEDNMLNAAIMDAYIRILIKCYDMFDVEGYVFAKDPNWENRGYVNLTSQDGLLVEMPMLVYMPGEPVIMPNGEEIVTWRELCKVTVKEIYDSEEYSVIEMENKWFEWVECEPGQNKVVPTMLVDKWKY